LKLADNDRSNDRKPVKAPGASSAGVSKPPTNLDVVGSAGSTDKKKKRNRRNKPAKAKVDGADNKPKPKQQGADSAVAPGKRNRDDDAEIVTAVPSFVEPAKRALTEAEQQYRSQVFTNTPFTDVPGLSEASLRAIKQFGFPTMTRIQALAIPAALQGKDVLIRAKTGHGKTLAFGVPLFECLLASRGGQG
jgi:superfamily II RNA helicase